MPEKTKSQTRETIKEASKPFNEMAEKAKHNYDQALRTTMKMQEDAVRWWNQTWNQPAMAKEWQERMANWTEMASGLAPLAQRRMQDALDLMEKNSRTNAELFRKATEAAQTFGPESTSKWMDVWASSLGAFRMNLEAAAELNSKAIDSWVSYIRKTAEPAAPRPA